MNTIDKIMQEMAAKCSHFLSALEKYDAITDRPNSPEATERATLSEYLYAYATDEKLTVEKACEMFLKVTGKDIRLSLFYQNIRKQRSNSKKKSEGKKTTPSERMVKAIERLDTSDEILPVVVAGIAKLTTSAQMSEVHFVYLRQAEFVAVFEKQAAMKAEAEPGKPSVVVPIEKAKKIA